MIELLDRRQRTILRKTKAVHYFSRRKILFKLQFESKVVVMTKEHCLLHDITDYEPATKDCLSSRGILKALVPLSFMRSSLRHC